MSNLEKFGEFDGIEMGVFADGTPFLTTSGLASICGVAKQTINEIGFSSPSVDDKFRAGKIAALLRDYDFQGDKLYEAIIFEGQVNNAYPEPVCLAILEYYASESLSGERSTDKARQVSRLLLRKTFRDFVYALTGYNTKQLTFSQYTLSRITYHHNIASDKMPLPDGYFCLFDKMIEILQKFDLRINYQMGESWYDVRDGKQRFIEPDISLGHRFSQLFTSNFYIINAKYTEEYNKRKNNSKIRKFWSQNLKDLRWNRDKAFAEKILRVKYKNLFVGNDPEYPILESRINRRKYDFNPSPDSNRTPDDVEPANCYSNDYTSLFYDWLRDVFFKFCWREYILQRDPDGWMKRYNQFLLLDEQKKSNILKTSEGGMISGFEFLEYWENQLPSSD